MNIKDSQYLVLDNIGMASSTLDLMYCMHMPFIV